MRDQPEPEAPYLRIEDDKKTATGGTWTGMRKLFTKVYGSMAGPASPVVKKIVSACAGPRLATLGREMR